MADLSLTSVLQDIQKNVASSKLKNRITRIISTTKSLKESKTIQTTSQSSGDETDGSQI